MQIRVSPPVLSRSLAYFAVQISVGARPHMIETLGKDDGTRLANSSEL